MDFNGHVYGLGCQWGCAFEDTIRVANLMTENADAPTRHAYRAASWKSSPGSSCRRVA
jgi:hypothetical protein